jgi:hypothetical protein
MSGHFKAVIPGRIAPYATSGERLWWDALAERMPASSGGAFSCVVMAFTTQTVSGGQGSR